MTTALPDLNTILADVKAADEALQTLLAFVTKFGAFLPANVRTSVAELQAIVNFVSALLDKFGTTP
jgi:hypothetical protein